MKTFALIGALPAPLFRVFAFIYIAGCVIAVTAIAVFLCTVAPPLGVAFVIYFWWKEFFR